MNKDETIYALQLKCALLRIEIEQLQSKLNNVQQISNSISDSVQRGLNQAKAGEFAEPPEIETYEY